jgi:uncharacterized protein
MTGPAPSTAAMDILRRAHKSAEAGEYAAARQLLQALAELGNAEAQFRLGRLHSFGQGGPADPPEAARLYRLAAEAGHAQAQYSLAVLYAQGRGVEQDYAQAMRWYKEAGEAAAQAGTADALFMVGIMYANAEGVPADLSQARHWWERAAVHGHGLAMAHLGQMLRDGDLGPPDPAAASEWYVRAWQHQEPAKGAGGIDSMTPDLERLAEAGDARAEYALGVFDKIQRGDHAAGAARLQRAAALGHPGAQELLGFCYRDGEGVSKDDARAAELFTLAAEAGERGSQYLLGAYYAAGRGGLPRDLDLAIRWMRRAAEQGERKALHPLAQLLAARNRDRRDVNEAFQRLMQVAGFASDEEEFSLAAPDGSWSIWMTQRGTVSELKGVTVDELEGLPED